MTRPRPIYAGDLVMKQKRCYRREFRLRPDPPVVRIIKYALAYCANKYGIKLHEFSFQSNHDHILNTDVSANRPAFYQLLHSLIARAVNSHYGDWEALWSSHRYSAPRIEDPGDSLRKLLYVLLNPVEAQLVRYVWDWAGATSWGMEYRKPETIPRPETFFSDDMPEEVELVIERPPGLRPELSDADLRRLIRDKVRERQGGIAARVKASGGTFMGMGRVLRQPRTSSPHTRAPRRGIRPAVIGLSKWDRIEAIQRNQAFEAAHERARLLFIGGNRDVEFPYGTYFMRVRINVRCRPP